jgi:protein-S-isoprenylcysteine O-methyltransferase Ste14
MHKKKILPPTFFNSAILIIVLLHFIFPITNFNYFPWNLFGIIPVLAGVVLNLLADSSFKKNATTVKPFEKSATLITHGVFRISRNPMYLGMVLMLVGICIFLGSVSPYLVILIFAVIIHYRFIPVEEMMLEKNFSSEWVEYKKSVRRWI